jgi:hypothetical protein
MLHSVYSKYHSPRDRDYAGALDLLQLSGFLHLILNIEIFNALMKKQNNVIILYYSYRLKKSQL